MACIHHCSITQNIFIALKYSFYSVYSFLSLHKPLANTGHFTVSQVLSFSKCLKVGSISLVAFSDWLLPLSNTHVWFLHVFLAPNTAVHKLSVCTAAGLSLHLLKDIVVASNSVIVNKTAINICAQFFCVHGCKSSSLLRKCRIIQKKFVLFYMKLLRLSPKWPHYFAFTPGKNESPSGPQPRGPGRWLVFHMVALVIRVQGTPLFV